MVKVHLATSAAILTTLATSAVIAVPFTDYSSGSNGTPPHPSLREGIPPTLSVEIPSFPSPYADQHNRSWYPDGTRVRTSARLGRPHDTNEPQNITESLDNGFHHDRHFRQEPSSAHHREDLYTDDEYYANGILDIDIAQLRMIDHAFEPDRLSQDLSRSPQPYERHVSYRPSDTMLADGDVVGRISDDGHPDADVVPSQRSERDDPTSRAQQNSHRRH